MFVTRHFKTRNDAFVAGALCGPLVILPGVAIFLMLLPFHPEIIDVSIPISRVLEEVGSPLLILLVQIAILGTLAATGAGLLHGVNERIANTMAERENQMPQYLRPGLALAAMLFSVFLATEVGIIDLVAKGMRYGAYAFIVVILLPLLTRGLWMIKEGKKGTEAELEP